MSIILAKLLGLYFLAIGLGFLLNPERLREVFPEAIKDRGFMFFGAIFALFVGAAIISVHNIWTLNWSLIITLLGWWSLLKGFLLLSYPKFADFFSFMQNRSDLFYRSLCLLYIVLGLFLLYKGFVINV